MKAKPFKGTPVPRLAGMGPSDTLTRSEVVALIASRVAWAAGDDDATVRNRVSSKVDYDVRKGKLCRQALNKFRLGDIGTWARENWPDARFHDVPTFPVSGNASLALSGYRGAATAYTHPATLEAAVEEILALRARIAALSSELAVCHTRVQALEGQVRRYRPGWLSRSGKTAR